MSALVVERAEFEAATIGWVRRNLEQFTVERVTEVRAILGSIKPIADLSLVAEALMLAPRHAELGHELIAHCWNELEQGDLLADLMLRDNALLVLASIYPTFHRAGKLNRRIVDRLAAVRATDLVHGSHQLPLAAAIHEVGLPGPWSYDELLAAEWAAVIEPRTTMSSADAYSMTHIVFYATSFGREAEKIGPYRPFLDARLDALVDQFLAQGNLDVLAELAILARIDSRDISDAGWRALLQARHADGMVPRAMNWPVMRLPTNDRVRARFLEHSHSTLVSIAACVSGSGRAGAGL